MQNSAARVLHLAEHRDLTEHQGPPGTLGTLPPMVAIHRVEAPADAGDTPTHGTQLFLDRREIMHGRTWRRIATVGNCMQQRLHALLTTQPYHRRQMVQMTVYAAVGDLGRRDGRHRPARDWQKTLRRVSRR